MGRAGKTLNTFPISTISGVFMDVHEAASPGDPKKVIATAVTLFAAHGYNDTKLDAIVRESGMSKRMIHYHFGDKHGLYTQALSAAIERLHLGEDELKLDTTVPVEGVRKLIDAMVDRFVHNPDSLRLLTSESLNPVVLDTTQTELSDESATTLYLHRLLMLGQDSGAFRPGISAADIYTIITALASFREINRELTLNLFDIDMTNERNTRGLHRMIVDAVLAFLTANIPDNGESSYITDESDESRSDSSRTLYDEGGSISDAVFFDE